MSNAKPTSSFFARMGTCKKEGQKLRGLTVKLGLKEMPAGKKRKVIILELKGREREFGKVPKDLTKK